MPRGFRIERTSAHTRHREITDPKLKNNGLGKNGYKEHMKFFKNQFENKEDNDHKTDVDKQDGDKKRKPLENAICIQDTYDVAAVDQVTVIPEPAESQSFLSAVGKLGMFAKGVKIQEQQAERALALQQQRMEAENKPPDPDKVDTQTSQSANRQDGNNEVPSDELPNDENVRPSENTLRKGAIDQNRRQEKRALGDITNTHRNDESSNQEMNKKPRKILGDAKEQNAQSKQLPKSKPTNPADANGQANKPEDKSQLKELKAKVVEKRDELSAAKQRNDANPRVRQKIKNTISEKENELSAALQKLAAKD